jgi:hypothetical protein
MEGVNACPSMKSDGVGDSLRRLGLLDSVGHIAAAAKAAGAKGQYKL